MRSIYLALARRADPMGPHREQYALSRVRWAGVDKNKKRKWMVGPF